MSNMCLFQNQHPAGRERMADIRIGKIVNAHGIKGEVKLISYSDDPDRFEMLESIIVKGPAGDRADAVSEYFIEDVRYKAGSIILKLEGIDDRNAAEAMKGSFVYMDEEDLPELEEGQFYVRDIAGSDVLLEDGRKLGTLKDVRTNTAQDLYIVSRAEEDPGRSDLMIPSVDEFIISVDPEAKRIVVRLPEGLEEI